MAPFAADTSEEESDVLRNLLARLPVYLENGWHDHPSGGGYFAGGASDENGIRTNSNLVFAAAVLLHGSARSQIDASQVEPLSERLIAVARYLIATHKTGTRTCTDGRKWGLTWQSSWWATKLALGVRVAGALFSTEDHVASERIIAAEADRHLTRLVPTGLAHDTKAEETAWDTEALATAIALCPAHPNVGAWRKRLVEFAVNTFSCPSDRNNLTLLDGQTVQSMIRSCNIHEDGTLENHGSSHFCYVASPLISKTWSAYALTRAGERLPAALSHNVERVWRFTEPTFLNNRFAYIAGQDWARYTYGEYFIVPALIYLDTAGIGQNCKHIFRQRLHTLAWEAEKNSDGSFFGERFTSGRYFGQFAKYETDCFACLALTLDLLDHQTATDTKPRVLAPETRPDSTRTTRISHETLCCYTRNANSFASFSWSTLTTDIPNATFVPLGDDSLGDWRAGNLLGNVRFVQAGNWIGVKAMQETAEGFVVEGSHSIRNSKGKPLAEHRLQLEVSNIGMRIYSRYVALSPLRAVQVTGLNWSLPNDVFNNFSRRICFDNGTATGGSHKISTSPCRPAARKVGKAQKVWRKLGLHGQTTLFAEAQWINVDDQVGLLMREAGDMVLRQPVQKEAPWESLSLDILEAPSSRWLFHVPAGATLLETKCLVHAGPSSATKALAKDFRWPDAPWAASA